MLVACSRVITQRLDAELVSLACCLHYWKGGLPVESTALTDQLLDTLLRGISTRCPEAGALICIRPQ